MISTAVFDLETSDLDADKGIVLCGCIKSSMAKKVITFRTDETNPGWAKGKRGNDKRTVELIVAEISKHDVIVAHNGGRFDVPFLRTRLLRWGLPRLPELKLVDPMLVAFRKLRLRSNGLANLSDHLGITERKTPLFMSLWMNAILNGDKASMDKIVEHCVADVAVLDKVLELVKPYIKLLDGQGSSL